MESFVSKIYSLEKELKHSLFERTNKGLRITAEGKMVREYASHIIKSHLAEFDGLVLYYSTSLGVKKGDALVTYGRIK